MRFIKDVYSILPTGGDRVEMTSDEAVIGAINEYVGERYSGWGRETPIKIDRGITATTLDEAKTLLNAASELERIIAAMTS